MKNLNQALAVIFMSVVVLLTGQTEADARKKLLPGRSDGMASIQVSAYDGRAVAQAIASVFTQDGYTLKDEWPGGLHFARSAGRIKDFSYGGLVSGGMWEQVMISIQKDGVGSYRIKCDVYMTEGDQKPDFMDTEVLDMFGREYQRMLRRVKRQLQ